MTEDEADSGRIPGIDDLRQHLDMARAIAMRVPFYQMQDATVRLSHRLSQLTLDYIEAVAGEVELAQKEMFGKAQ